MLDILVSNYLDGLTEATPVRVVVDQIVASHPQHSPEAVRAAIEQVLDPPDTAEGHLGHAKELERYFTERDTAKQ